MQDQSARPPYLPSQAGMVNGDGHSYQTHSLRPPGGQFPTYAEQRQQQQTPMKVRIYSNNLPYSTRIILSTNLNVYEVCEWTIKMVAVYDAVLFTDENNC